MILGDDYIDTDVAYLLGMLFGRGSLTEKGNIRTLLVRVRILRRTPKLPPGAALDLDLEMENERALNRVRSRINELVGADVDILNVAPGESHLRAIFVKNTIGWRDLRLLTSDGSDNSDFLLPKEFLKAPGPVLREFVRGFADVAVMPSFSDNHFGKHARIAFPVVFANRKFAKQLMKILKALNTDPKFLSGDPAKRGGSVKEHRIRLYADEYSAVGFSFDHKNEILKLLVDHNRREGR